MAIVLKHIVLFKFTDTAPEAEITKVVAAFLELKTKIPVVQAIEWGTDISVENKNQGFTHCFCLTFRDVADRDAYLPHPAHQEFGARLQPIKEKVLVFDYLTEQ